MAWQATTACLCSNDFWGRWTFCHPAGVKFSSNFATFNTPTSTTLSNVASKFLNSLSIIQQTNGGSADPRFSLWKIQQMTDPRIYDFYTQMLEGPNKYEDQRWRSINVAVEQRLGANAGIELALDWQTLDNAWSNPLASTGYAITLDINSKLPNGQANPSFGRTYFADNQGGLTGASTTTRQAFRATAYYNLNLKRMLRASSWLGGILGQHTFTGSYTNQRAFLATYQARPYNMGLDYFNAEQATSATTLDNTMTGSPRRMYSMAYVGPSVLNASSPQNTGIQNVRTNILLDGNSVGVLYYQSPRTSAGPISQWETRNFSIVTGDHWNRRYNANSQAQVSTNQVQSSVVVANSRWFENTLISTVGTRRDLYRTLDSGQAAFGANGLPNYDPSVFYQKLTLNARQDQTSYGLVGHAPAAIRRWLPDGVDLSAIYNKSDNFVAGSQRFTVYNQTIAPSTGTTKEYGFVVSAFHNKLEFRATHFKSGAIGATNSNLTSTIQDLTQTPVRIINNVVSGSLNTFADGTSAAGAIQAWNDFIRGPVAKPYLETFNYVFSANGIASNTLRNGIVVATSDIVSEGWEYDLIVNPTRGWRVSLNASKATAVTANTARDLAAMLGSWKPLLIDGPAGKLLVAQGGSQTVSDWLTNTINQVNKEVALEGSPTPEMRRWRLNFVNNYEFSSERLKGWNVGGAVRWQDKSAIGYPVRVLAGNLPQLDITRPFFGSKETNYDAWCGYTRPVFRQRITWKAQLNVRNLGVNKKLIPVNASPDGTINAYRIAEPITWTLTNSFAF
jgi:hypothetical protein